MDIFNIFADVGTFGFLVNMTALAKLCFVIGFLFVVFEMFHPGFGAPGITGGILLVIGIALTAKNITDVLIMLVATVAILAVALTFVLQSATKGRLSKVLILKETQKKEAGFIGTEDLNYFLGHEGTALTMLRPAGIADFDGIKLDVVSEGEFILKDSKIKVIKVQGRRIVVRENTSEKKK